MAARGVILFGIVFFAVLASLVARIFFCDAICRPAIRKWAIQEKIDYAIDDYDWLEELILPDGDPFFFRKTRSQKVYRLLVTKDGQEKIAYVRVGHWFLGLLYPIVVMRWAKEIPNHGSGREQAM